MSPTEISAAPTALIANYAQVAGIDESKPANGAAGPTRRFRPRPAARERAPAKAGIARPTIFLARRF